MVDSLNGAVLGTLHFNKISTINQHRILDTFFSAGGVVVDTAPLYGGWELLNRIEKSTRKWGNKRKVLVKMGYFEKVGDYRDLTYLQDVVDRVLDIFGTQASIILHEADWSIWWNDCAIPDDLIHRSPISVVQIHSSPAFELFSGLKDRGIEIGISGNNAAEIAFVSDALAPDIAMLAKQYDLLWRTAAQYLPVIDRFAKRVILASPWHQGWLFRLRELSKIYPALSEDILKLTNIMLDHGRSIAESAIPFIRRSFPNVGIAIGVSNAEELEQAILSYEREIEDGLFAALKMIGITAPPMHHFLSIKCSE